MAALDSVPSDNPASSSRPEPRSLKPEETLRLLQRLQQDDAGAREELFKRYLPPLRRFAHGRLPAFARSMHESGDVVQDAFVAALPHLTAFHARHEGALLHYFKQCVRHRIYDLMRWHGRRPEAVDLDPDQFLAETSTPLDKAIRRDLLDRCDQAMELLSEDDQQAIMLKYELDYDNAEIADALDLPSAEAARQAVRRAVLKLAQQVQALR